MEKDRGRDVEPAQCQSTPAVSQPIITARVGSAVDCDTLLLFKSAPALIMRMRVLGENKIMCVNFT